MGKNIKIFTTITAEKLEKLINEFIKDKRIIDIQYKCEGSFLFVLYSAMIIYA
ncbi:MAG: hypothetical protein ABFD25_09190 [Clostridiaceae bacterium]